MVMESVRRYTLSGVMLLLIVVVDGGGIDVDIVRRL